MKTSLLRGAAPVLAAVCALCTTTASAAPTTQRHTLESFTSIEANGGLDVTVVTGPPLLTVTGEAKDLPRLRHHIENGQLVLSTEGVSGWLSISTGPSLKVTVQVPALEKVVASGGVDLDLTGMQRPALELELSGGVDVKASRLAIAALTIEASGGADVKLAGTTQHLKLEATGGSDIDTEKLDALTAEVDASGGADVVVRARQTVDADVSGAADVRVRGDATAGTIECSGAGSIRFESQKKLAKQPRG